MPLPRKAWRHATTALILAGALITTPAPAMAFDLPQLGSATSGVNPSEEYRLGRTWLRQFRARAPLWQDPISRDYVDALIARLLPDSGFQGGRPLVTLVDSRLLNAFAVPGGVIGVNAGLFAFAEDEAALASVLAHELGHLSLRHYARQQARVEETQLPTMAAMLAGMLIAAGGGGDAGIAAAMGSQAAFIQDQLAYSRRFEQEADRQGLQVLRDAGYDPQAMVEMFRAMQRQSALQGGNPPEFLLTHPVTESRISDAQARAAGLGAGELRDPGPLYDMVRARALLTIHRDAPPQAASLLAQGDAAPAAERYLAALIRARGGDLAGALATLDTLTREWPDLPLIPTSAAELALDAGRHGEALRRSQHLLRLMPDYLPARLIEAEALLQQDARAAFEALRDLAEAHPEDPQVFTLLAEAAGRSQRAAWSHLARAEQLQLTGRITQGIRQLDIAEELAKQEGEIGIGGRISERREAFETYREAMKEFQ
ncbi:M48 family metalloprotease [Halomonas sp. YLGW01]|uniref:M48 family metalloprotease n=1 Tax=Halomonas sp. YLGW01 TaxID=2773308 RepID=UPI00178671F1|nr:M48 family metalloprotease [Halomonas sp. YLGW01]